MSEDFKYRGHYLEELQEMSRQEFAELLNSRGRRKIEKNNAFDRLNLNDAKARKQELESLLEELKGEVSE